MNSNIIYLMGAGRSGTTILEVLLHNSPGISAAGELTKVLQYGFLNGTTCSCGHSVDTCEVWRRVKESSLSDIHVKVKYLKQLDYHSGLIKAVLNSHSKDKWEKYLETNRLLFSTVEDASPTPHIVDASKYAARALNLHRAFPKKVKVICLLRNPMGFIHKKGC